MRTFNRACVVSRAIHSVLAQTYEDFELLVVDDASTDETVSIVQSYAEHDSRISVFTRSKNSRKQRPQAEPMNDGLRRCRGAYITHLDDDNVWHPDFLKVAVRALEQNEKMAVCYSDTCNHLSPTRLLKYISVDNRQFSFVGNLCFVAPHLSRFEPLKINATGFSYNDYIDTNEMVLRAEAMGKVGNRWIPHPKAQEISRSQGKEFLYRTHADMYLVERIVAKFGPQACQYVPGVLCHHVEHTHPRHLDPDFDPILDARAQGLE
jgi:glycosyltransferase involved in cell wall biosynthesis